MNFPSIRIEGAILSADLLDAIRREDKHSQKAVDFNLPATAKVKDEIASTWASAKALWGSYQAKVSLLRVGDTGTSETRNLLILPLLSMLAYEPEKTEAETVNGKSYAISHRDVSRDGFPLHIMGWHDSLDKKRTSGGPRMSPHALVQEYLNLTEHLYAIVTNGQQLRLLRDSSRLIKLSYLEFDLIRMFEEDLYADFAILFRLLHASRMPVARSSAEESVMEQYHQDSLDSGSRIRAGLSKAVDACIVELANGFLTHPDNEALREAAAKGEFPIDGMTSHQKFSGPYYQAMLRLVYRLLFLLVTEERGLIQPRSTDRRKIQIYRDYYSLSRLRNLSESLQYLDPRHADAWQALLRYFRLFETGGKGAQLDIQPLGGLFDRPAIGLLNDCTLDNEVLLGCLRKLSLFQHPVTKVWMRVNYAALNVEEFGSVYEGLLEYDPDVRELSPGQWQFAFVQGDDRSASGSHYTPDELVQPLIKHSLDYIIADKLKEKNPEQALLSITVCDVACGSGHILLNAARRIATELAILRTGEDQPSPESFRDAIRDVIRNCIYGVDLNPLAVELCKVAMWLEAHSPGQPLNFLDHHIKCGNAIVGLARKEELERGIPDEAFKTLTDDDKDFAAELRKRNKEERKGFMELPWGEKRQADLNALNTALEKIQQLPETTPEEIHAKEKAYAKCRSGLHLRHLRQLANLQVAQFYISKTPENKRKVTTHDHYRRYLAGEQFHAEPIAASDSVAYRKRFFHWFLEFPEVMGTGGFDCILGNPPYLNGQKLSGNYGHQFCEYLKWQYQPAGLSDLVVFFLRRIHHLLAPQRFLSMVTTNSIIDGDNRRDGLACIVENESQINMAIRSRKWPGEANVVISVFALHKGPWNRQCELDGRPVEFINSFFEEGGELPDPVNLRESKSRVFQGVIFLGDGFVLSADESAALVSADGRNSEVIAPLLNCKELNNNPDQRPGRQIINFKNWPVSKASEFKLPFERIEREVKPVRLESNRELYREKWWVYAERRPGLTAALARLDSCFVTGRVTKYINWSSASSTTVFLNNCYVLTTDRWDLLTIVQSSVHDAWARKHSMSLKQDLQYSPSNCFNTFAFPEGLWQTPNHTLAEIGERYHEHRKSLMQPLWLGLTKIYNLFHARDLSPEMVATVSGKDEATATAGYEGLLELRRLHCELDLAVRDAYGWTDLDLEHGFHKVETLPENDRVRYTISPGARREVLKRLLAENHKRAAQEAQEVEQKPKGAKKKSKAKAKKADDKQQSFF